MSDQILKEILNKLESLEKGQLEIKSDQVIIKSDINKFGLEFEDQKKDIKTVAEGIININRSLLEIKSDIKNIDNRLTTDEDKVRALNNKIRAF